MSRPRAVVLTAPGTNRDGEMAEAFERAGAEAEVVPVAALREEPTRLRRAQLLGLAGGFTHADALGAGRLWGLDLQTALADELQALVAQGTPVIGICNGFQALTRAGLLPGALAPNASGSFVCRWVALEPSSSRCVWTAGLDEAVRCPVAHGEGRYVVTDEVAAELRRDDRVAFVYAEAPLGTGNPNGSVGGIAGVTDETGLVLGLMPHPEDHLTERQHPRRARGERGGLGLRVFERGVAHVQGRS